MLEHYNQRMDEALQDLTVHIRIVEDILVPTLMIKEQYERTVAILERCRAHGITLSPKKFTVCEPEVIFARMQISKDGYTINQRCLRPSAGSLACPQSQMSSRSWDS